MPGQRSVFCFYKCGKAARVRCIGWIDMCLITSYSDRRA